MSSVKVIEKNEGTKIAYKQSTTKLTFGDDELMLNCAKYQKDYPVSIDICGDKSGNLVIGMTEGLYYVAQVAIPATEYKEVEAETTADTTTEDGTTTNNGPQYEPVALDMADVTLTLWSIDGLRN